jgi:hypothetical protein
MMKVEGTKQLQARLKAVEKAPKPLMRTLGLTAVREQKKLVARKTGNTGRTIRLSSVTRDSATTTVGGAGAFLEYGTKPHIIRPRRARVLAFPASGTARTLGGRARKGGRMAFAKMVRHPGTKPQPFMVPGALRALQSVGIAAKIIDAWNKGA